MSDISTLKRNALKYLAAHSTRTDKILDGAMSIMGKSLPSKIRAAQSGRDVMSLILANRGRFSDNNGNPALFVQNALEKAFGRKDYSKLVKTVITNKNGKRQTVYKRQEDVRPVEKIKQNASDKNAVAARESVKAALDKYAEPFPENKITTREQFNAAFKNGIDTPIGKVKFGEHQFDKFAAKNRVGLIVAAKRTLENPVAIINDNGADVFAKSFARNDGGKKIITSIVITKDGDKISISSHEKTLNNIFNKIKNGRDVIFITDTAHSGDSYQNDTAVKNVADDEKKVKQNAKKIFATADDVKAFYKDTSQWMKAPNGEPTKLTERQWCQVRTDNFKKWFGDWEGDPQNASKVVDENGEPMVCYHGTDAEFDTFRTEEKAGGNNFNSFFFTPVKDFANFFTHTNIVKEVFLLSVKKPFRFSAKGQAWNKIKIFVSDLEKLGVGKTEYREFFQKDEGGVVVSSTDNISRAIAAAHFIGKNDFDGVWFSDVSDGHFEHTEQIVVFQPNQIKSATDNNGDFDANSDNINKSIGQVPVTPPSHASFLRNYRAIVERLKALAAAQAKRDKIASKAIEGADVLEKGKKAGIGEIRVWKGKKYKKFGAGDWRRIYDNEGRGARNAYSRLVKRLGERLRGAKDDDERNRMCLQFVLEHKQLFQDADGHPLPLVQNLVEDVQKAARGEYRTQKRGAKAKKTTEAKAGGGNGGDEPPKSKFSLKRYDGKKDYTTTQFSPKDLKDLQNDDLQKMRDVHKELAEKFARAMWHTEKNNDKRNRNQRHEHLFNSAETALYQGSWKEINDEIVSRGGESGEPPNTSKPKAPKGRNILEKFVEALKKDRDLARKMKADGKDDKEIVAYFDEKYKDKKYGGGIKTIATLPPKFMFLFPKAKNSDIKCGIGYFINHAANHHPENSPDMHLGMQFDLDESECAYKDTKTGAVAIYNPNTSRNSIILKEGENGNLIFYKSTYNKDKIPAKWQKIIPASNEGNRDFASSGANANNAISRNSRDESPAGTANISSLPDDTDIIDDNEKNVKQNPQENEKKSRDVKTFDDIKSRWADARKVEGDEDALTLPDGSEVSGRWVLTEAEAPTASHDEMTFQKTAGFPTTAEGGTINDRDYEHDKAAQDAVIDMAGGYDARALSLDSPVVVSSDGVVVSGNNRTMSSKLAAKKGTDAKYVEALKKKAKKFGLSPDDIGKFSHPRVVFLADGENNYSTSQFAKFNQSSTKAQSPVDKGIKVGKTIPIKSVESIAEKMDSFDTLGDLYANGRVCGNIFADLVDAGILQKVDLPQYYSDGAITGAGKEFLETALLGSVMSEGNLRLLSQEGGKALRQKLVRAIVPLSQNKSMQGYSITDDLNEAVRLTVEAKQNGHKDAYEYAKAPRLDGFEQVPNEVALELIKKLELPQKDFSQFMRDANGSLRDGANGQPDMWLGRVSTREELLSQVFGKEIKKAIAQLRKSLMAMLRDA